MIFRQVAKARANIDTTQNTILTTAAVYMKYRDIIVEKELRALKQQQTKNSALMLNVTKLEYN